MPVRVRSGVVGFSGDECDCGRRSSILHCNACGSTRVYARSARVHTFLNGEQKFVDLQFRCQTCGHLFVPEERQFCDAPPVSNVLAKLKVQRLVDARKQGEFLRPAEAQAAQVIQQIVQDAQAEGAIPEQVPEQASTEAPQEQPQTAEEILLEAKRHTVEAIPNGLTSTEFFNARQVFIAEWTAAKIQGFEDLPSVDEYIKRRFAGEVIL